MIHPRLNRLERHTSHCVASEVTEEHTLGVAAQAMRAARACAHFALGA